MKDPHSFARPDEAVVKHLDLNLTVDFDKKILSGTATCDIEVKDNVNQIILDTNGLNIKNVTIDGKPAQFKVGEEVKFIGRPLTINCKSGNSKLSIEYSTTPGAAALQWLTPEQTAGKKFPFLFTQSQAILARTWVPCQDGPGMRFTYSATVKVPHGLMAVMSAENPVKASENGIYHYNMPQPIPAYLLALAVGDFVFHPFDKRTGVYAEPATIDKAVYEFADLPKMVDAAEKLYGPYAWGQYDLIVLPPSFPFGGMENPRITFATPTILAGDRSLTSLVAHELAHSWSGNLVTNATWNDFWMNEGFTVYFENRIMEALYGKDFDDMQKILGQEDLRETIAGIGEASIDTHLKLQLDGRDPDDGMTEVAYEKGNNLLLLIEQTIGREKLDVFLKSYFQRHKFHSITTEQFLYEYKNELVHDHSDDAKKIEIEKWIYGPGIPSNMVKIESAKFNHADKQVSAYKNGAAATALDTKSFTAFEWIRFLRAGLPNPSQGGASKPIWGTDKLTELDKAFHFTESGNSEILFVWLQLVITAAPPLEGWGRLVYASLENFLVNVGRRKFVKPLFQQLAKTPEGKEMAKKIYAKARPNYHSITQGTVDEILK